MSSSKQFILSFFICIAAFSFLGYLVNGYFEKTLFSDNQTGKNPENHYAEVDPPDIFSDPVSDGEGFSALIVGKDLSTDTTDALILVRADRGTEKFMVCSIPPRARYAITGTDSEGNKYTGSMSFGDTVKNYGVPYLIDKIYALTNLDIDYYAIIDTDDARRLFNEFCGSTGLRYTVPEDMEYDDIYEDIHLTEGDQYLNGAAALQLLRYREYKSGNGDVKRCTTQVEVIRAFAKAALSSENPLKARLLDENVRTKLLSGVETNVTAGDIADNLDLVFSLGDFEFVSIPFRYSAMVSAENVSSIHEDFTRPFEN